MARARAFLDLQGSQWVLHLGSTSETLRQKLPPPEDAVEVQDLTPPDVLDAAVGVNSRGDLVPLGVDKPMGTAGSGAAGMASGGDQAGGHTNSDGIRLAAAQQCQQQPLPQPQQRQQAKQQELGHDRTAVPGSSAQAVQPSSLAAITTAERAAEQAAAAAVAAPPRKRLKKAGQMQRHSTSPGGGHAAGLDGANRSDGFPVPAPNKKASPGLGDGSAGADSSASMFDNEEQEEDVDEAAQQDRFDTQCALCDDGGKLLCCDGPCMRSFHAGLVIDESGNTVADPDSCNLLALPADLALLLTDPHHNDTFLCPNCLAGIHQCYACKKEGVADKEVFKCINASCGRHYHPKCAGVPAGLPFVCQLHTCVACKGYADQGSKSGEVVPCRRCPVAYHRRCLPADLPWNREVQRGARVWLADQDEDGNWLDGVEQSLLYCTRHPIDKHSGQALFNLPTAAGKKLREYRLLRDDLHRAALRHYAQQHQHLQSSRELLAEEAAQKRRVQAQAAAAPAAAVAAAAAPAVAAGPDAGSESEEDIPLARKLARRRLVRAGALQKKAQPAMLSPQQVGSAAAAAAAALPPAAHQAQQQRRQAAAPSPKQQQQQPSPAKMVGPGAATAGVATAGAATTVGIATAAAAPSAPAAQQLQQAEESATTDAADYEEMGEEVEQHVVVGLSAGAAKASAPARAAAAKPVPARLGADDAGRLEDALERLVHAPSRRRRHERITRLLQQAEEEPSLTKNALWRATRRPEPYRHAMKKTIDEAKLRELERSVSYAVGKRLPDQQLMQLLDAQSVKSVLNHYDDLFMVLAPYLHGARYSSYGRHFTSKELLHRVADRLVLFLCSGDQVVDFSAGENYFVPYLKRRCLESGVAITGRSYDIILARDDTDFVLKSWFDTKPGLEGLCPPQRLCICLNPPFGKNNSLADKFVRHAATFMPRLIALIVPPKTIIPNGYAVVYENGRMCGGEEFYVPGSSHRSWNKEWPVLRILMRLECRPHLAQLGDAGEFEVLADCTAMVQHQHHAAVAAAGHVGMAAPAYGTTQQFAMMPSLPHHYSMMSGHAGQLPQHHLWH